ncbi:MAG: phospholipase D-like domain-containing protein [Flavobacteriales bacterium]|nr:phospholipase D-like domain-containing protein [Flavobacteriales bacterium]
MKKICLFTFALLANLCVLAQSDILDARTNFSIGQEVTVTGIVTNDGSLGSVRYIQDESAGIAIYPGQNWDGFTEPMPGDEITVTGLITEFNGLLEVGPDLSVVSINSSGNALPEPLVITPAQMNESVEGQLVRINAAVFAAGGQIIQGNSTYNFTSAGEDGVAYFRTSNALVGEVLTSCDANITGVASQFSFDGFGGYQLLLRNSDDFEALQNICISSTIDQDNITTTSFDITWTTDAAGDSFVEFGTTPELGDEVYISDLTTDHVVTLDNLEPGTIYYVQVSSNLNGETTTSNILPFATVSLSSGEILAYFTGSVDTSVATDEEAISLGFDMNDTIAAYITRAQHTLDIAVYNINNDLIENAINTAYNNGVQIRYIAEGSTANIGVSDFNDNIPVLYREDNEGSGMHNKFLIADAEYTDLAYVLTGSTNWTEANLTTDYNNLVVIQDESLAKAYTIEFNEMWGSEGALPDALNSKFGPEKSINTPRKFIIGGSPVELIFSPTDGTTNAIRDAVLETDYDLHFALLAFTRDEIADAMLEVNSIFVNMNGIIEQESIQGSEFIPLNDGNVPVYSHEGIANTIHHKYCIIDHSQPASDPTVITGSHNWSSTAENINDENTLIIHDARLANLFYQEYKKRLDELTVNIDEVSAGIDMKVYPNPAQNVLNLQLNELAQENMIISLSDLSGKIVGQWNMNSNFLQIETAAFSRGMYILSIQSTSGIKSAKVQLQ